MIVKFVLMMAWNIFQHIAQTAFFAREIALPYSKCKEIDFRSRSHLGRRKARA